MKPGTVFYKMTGSGNDFVMFDGRYVKAQDLTAAAIVAICDRRLGIGADGVAVLEPPAANQAGVHFAFRFWNRDGSPGPMCGNGALCATRLAGVLELVAAGEEVRFSTPAGIHRGRVVEGDSEIWLPDCAAPLAVPAVKTVAGEEGPMLARPSVPPLVLRVKDVDRVPLEDRGPPLRRDPALGEGGANVNWVAPKGDGTWTYRTFERGVEGETLACGTGAVACALVLAGEKLVQPPVKLWTRSGLPLVVNWDQTPSGVSSLRLRGEGRVVYRGILGHLVNQALPTE